MNEQITARSEIEALNSIADSLETIANFTDMVVGLFWVIVVIIVLVFIFKLTD